MKKVEIQDVSGVVRRVANETPLYRSTTKAKLYIAAHLLDELAKSHVDPDPEAADGISAESSEILRAEDSESATDGPGLTPLQQKLESQFES